LCETVLRRILTILADLDYKLSPPEIGKPLYDLIKEVSGINDPFRKERREQNQVALGLLPRMRNIVEQSHDPWSEAVKLAIAGNAIDLGIRSNMNREDIERSIIEMLDYNMNTEDTDELRKAVEKADSILYLGDNAGEIVFDMLLIEQMPKEKICFVVRGAPALNDVIMEDAEYVGLTRLVEVIDNGSGITGTSIPDCSRSFQQRFNQADLIIAKGQGNYETLSDVEKNTFFLLKVKCPVIAMDIGIEIEKMVVINRRLHRLHRL